VPGTNKQILESFPEIHWLNAGGNVGFSKANNLGAKQARGNFLLFLNTDTLLFNNAILNAHQHLMERDDVAAIGGLQLNLEKESIPFYYSLNDLRKDFYFIPNHDLFKKMLLALFPNENFQPGETNNLVGAFIMVSKEKFEKVGAWDEQFFMYAEDAELSFRLNKIGKLMYSDEVKFIHLVKGNEFTRANDSWANRFSVQIQLSNFLWIRKSYGAIPLLLIYFNYLIFIPIFWVWKMFKNTKEGKRLLGDTFNQRMLTRKVGILFSYLPQLLFLTSKQYKIKPEENIGK
jgi:GT2 family glycosyltransferase